MHNALLCKKALPRRKQREEKPDDLTIGWNDRSLSGVHR
jgi:hypothetical protein